MKLGLIVLAALLLKAGEMLAQSDLAAITGTVKDATGAVIVGAEVVATHLSSNLQSSAATNAAGAYTL